MRPALTPAHLHVCLGAYFRPAVQDLPEGAANRQKESEIYCTLSNASVPIACLELLVSQQVLDEEWMIETVATQTNTNKKK